MKESESAEPMLGKSHTLRLIEGLTEDAQREAEMVQEFQRRIKLNREGHLHDVVSAR